MSGNKPIINLFLTGLPETWEINNQSVCLGEWCKIPGQEYTNVLSDIPTLPYHWKSQNEIRDAIDYTEEVYEELLPIISGWLNEIHNLDKQVQYWRIILGKYLHYYISYLYDRYICLKKACLQFDSVNICGIDSSSFITPADNNDFMKLIVTDDLFNHQLFTQIACWLGYDIHTVKYDRIHEKNNAFENHVDKSDSIRKIKIFLSNIMYSKNRATHCEVPIINTNMPRHIALNLSIRSLFTIQLYRHPDNYKLNNTRNYSLRKGLSELEASDDFATLVLRSLEINMPFSFIENFMPSLEYSINVMKNKNYPALYVMGYTPSNVKTLAWIANGIEKGSKLLGVQHGGAYGEFLYDSREHYERSISDYYVTWGWKSEDDDIPMPAPLLIDLPRQKNRKNEDYILWIGTACSRYPEMLWNQLYYPTQNYYHRRQIRFYNSLSENIKNKILLRLKPGHEEGMDIWLKEKLPGLKLDDYSEKYIDCAVKAQIIVCDHLGGTTFLEALAMNKPIIAFSQVSNILIRDNARPYYELLKKYEIIHETPESAGKLLNKIYGNIDEFWNDNERQQAIQQYKRTFARTSNTPVKDWNVFIKSIL